MVTKQGTSYVVVVNFYRLSFTELTGPNTDRPAKVQNEKGGAIPTNGALYGLTLAPSLSHMHITTFALASQLLLL